MTICELAERKKDEGMLTLNLLSAIRILDYDEYREDTPKQKNGCSYTPKSIIKNNYFQQGKFLLHTRGHFIALIDGIIEDWSANTKKIIFSRVGFYYTQKNILSP